jgi:hypothetical protein
MDEQLASAANRMDSPAIFFCLRVQASCIERHHSDAFGIGAHKSLLGFTA